MTTSQNGHPATKAQVTVSDVRAENFRSQRPKPPTIYQTQKVGMRPTKSHKRICFLEECVVWR
eukprot:5044856-Amphidinium_carterae.1